MIIAIIQARMGSTRLPNKVLKILGGKPVLEQIFYRLKKCRYIDEIFVATTINPNNLPIVKFCSSNGIRVFCGSEDDVLDRYYQLARLIKPDHVIRITSDCPVIDPELIDSLIKSHIQLSADYTSNTIVDSFPDGLDAEVFKFEALRKSWTEAKLSSEREHVTPFIKKHPEIFVLNSIESKVNYCNKRWTLDTESDYQFLKLIYEELYDTNPFFTMKDILNLLEAKPYLENINQDNVRNEGYTNSLKKDKLINEK